MYNLLMINLTLVFTDGINLPCLLTYLALQKAKNILSVVITTFLVKGSYFSHWDKDKEKLSETKSPFDKGLFLFE